MLSLSLGFCNLLRLLPRLASGSAVKGVGEGGAGVGALWQWDGRDTDAGPRVAEQHPPSPGVNWAQALHLLPLSWKVCIVLTQPCLTVCDLHEL